MIAWEKYFAKIVNGLLCSFEIVQDLNGDLIFFVACVFELWACYPSNSASGWIRNFKSGFGSY